MSIKRYIKRYIKKKPCLPGITPDKLPFLTSVYGGNFNHVTFRHFDVEGHVVGRGDEQLLSASVHVWFLKKSVAK